MEQKGDKQTGAVLVSRTIDIPTSETVLTSIRLRLVLWLYLTCSDGGTDEPTEIICT